MTGAAANSGWQGYWAADRAASCLPENPATAQQIAADWLRWFSALPSDQRLLDVATGNGIVLSHAARAAREQGKRFSFTGVDLADIDPVRHVSNLEPALRQAQFLGGVAAEHLPFEASSFEIVTSQYGLEYASLDQALSETARVLVPGGRLRWLAHCEGSDVVAQHRSQVAEVDFLLARAGPIERMRAFVGGARSGADMREVMEGLLAAFAAAEQFCRSHPPARVVRQVCGEFAEVAKRYNAYDPADLQCMLDAGERELQAHRGRIGDLLCAVLTRERLQRVEALLAQPRWTGAMSTELRVGEGPSLIGLVISAQRSALAD